MKFTVQTRYERTVLAKHCNTFEPDQSRRSIHCSVAGIWSQNDDERVAVAMPAARLRESRQRQQGSSPLAPTSRQAETGTGPGRPPRLPRAPPARAQVHRLHLPAGWVLRIEGGWLVGGIHLSN